MLFPEKLPMGVSDFADPALRKELKAIASQTKTFMVTPEELRKVLVMRTQLDCYKLTAGILTIVDEMGSYSLPVFKMLTILVSALRDNQHGFVECAKVFLPEIRTILLYSFGEENSQYREQVHFLVQAIYNYLSGGIPLPADPASKPEKFEPKITSVPQSPVARVRDRSSTVKSRSVKIASDDDDGDDDAVPIRLSDSRKSVRSSFNPFSSNSELISFAPEPTAPVQAAPAINLMDFSHQNQIPPPADAPNPPVEHKEPEPVIEEPKPEGIDNPRPLDITNRLRLIKEPAYDDLIESY